VAETITVNVTELNVKVGYVGEDPNSGQKFVDDITVLLRLERTSYDPKHQKPSYQILSEISDIKVTLSDAHIQSLASMAQDFSRPTPKRSVKGMLGSMIS